MPIDYKIEVEKKLVRTTAWGVTTAEELIGHEVRLRHDPLFDPSFHLYADFMGVTSMDLTADELRSLAGAGPWSRESYRVVAMPNALFFGQARMYEAFNEMNSGSQFMVIIGLDEAKKWLEEKIGQEL